MSNSKKQTIIILHGWKLQALAYHDLVELLKKNGYTVFAWDLPGFGKEPLPSSSLTLSDYVQFVVDKMKEHKIEHAIFIGHSFGGRIALKLAYQYPKLVKKVILTGVPVVKNRSFTKKIQLFGAKAGKQISRIILPDSVSDLLRKALYCAIGEWDYYKAGPLTQTFQNIVAEDLLEYVIHAKVPLVFVWGKNDTIVPVSLLKTLQPIKPDAYYIELPGLGHSPLRDNAYEYFNAIAKYV